MLDINYIRENPEEIKQIMVNRGADLSVDQLLKLDKQRRDLIQQAEDLKYKKNLLSGDKPTKEHIADSRQIGERLKKVEKQKNKAEEQYFSLLSKFPNIHQPEVFIGKGEADNREIKKVGQPPKFSFKIKDYMELAGLHDLIDTERAAKVSGARFGYLKNQAVNLQFALIQYALDILQSSGFRPFITPVLVKKEIMEKTGYDSYTKGQDAYFLEKENLYLVGTGEHALISYHANEILNGGALPLRYTAYSSCFRREAGSYGKDTKGILRVHQFDKLEMITLTTPEKSVKEFNFLLSLQEKLVQGLELPYRLLEVCTGDLPKPSAKVIDLECWLPSENKYRETHSVSNCTDYQARLLNIKYRDSDNKKQHVHILNGTAFAVGRTLIAILENNQQKDGSIKAPKALHKYLSFKEIKSNGK